MMTLKRISIVALFLVGCSGAPIESGEYSAPGGYRMVVSNMSITVSKGEDGVPFAKLKNTTRVWPVADSEDGRKYVIRVSDNGEVTLVRKEKPPFERKEIVFKKDK